MPVTNAAKAQPTNIAAGKTAVFAPQPNYALCTDPEDARQLTDGKYSSDGQLAEVQNTTSIWVQKGTVGWQNRSPVVITFDLGAIQPISGLSFSTAAGRAGVYWPTAIFVAVSDDNKTWHVLGDLVELAQKSGMPPSEGYANYRYVTHDLKTHGRYVAFAVVSSTFAFVDEIEIYAGEPQWIHLPASDLAIADIGEYAWKNINMSGVKQRMRSDANAIRALIKSARISQARKTTLDQQLSDDERDINELAPLPENFRAIVPLNDTHRNIFAVYGELLKAQGLQPLTIWKQHRFSWLPLLARPSHEIKPELNFSMLQNQFRSDALLLTNASATPQTVNIKLLNAPSNAQPGWLKVDAVAWTDTQEGVVVPDALLPVVATDEGYTITVPAGITQKMWFTVDSSKLTAGNTKSTLEISNGEMRTSVPLNCDIAHIAMKKPRLSLGMWDYTDGGGNYGITPQNRDAAIKLMRSHFVDTPWASSAALPRPPAAAFDGQGNLTEKLDFARFDEWVARWPGAKQYFVFANVSDSFAGAKMDTPEFTQRVGSWAKVLSAHMKELGLQPAQLGLLLVDEPRNETQDAIIAAWAKAINATAPELTLFEDPIWMRPDQTKIQEAITEIDILCPMLTRYYQSGEPVEKYFSNLREQGKQLWFYQCTGPVRTFDPQTYYRYQAWHTFAIKGTGQGFWSFGDTGQAASSWNEYTSKRVSYAPAFIDKNTVNNSVHWDAVREGMEDFEELAMLQDAIDASANAAWKTKAQSVLDNAVRAITKTWDNKGYQWNASTPDAHLADAQLAKVRALLIAAS